MTDAGNGGTVRARHARRMWQLYEPIHDVTYFAPEAREAADRIGMRGFWMGYVAQRAAPLGAVGAEVAAAAFFGFHPTRLSRALPEAWGLASPARALAARLAGADAALRRLWGPLDPAVLDSADLAEAAELAWRAAAVARTEGRVLAAANQALERPGPAHLALWQAATTLREHRGDGHNAVLVTRGITPVGAHLLKAAAAEADGEVLREGRRHDPNDWRHEEQRLRGVGWLDRSGRLTELGQAMRADVEAATDAAAEQPWTSLGPVGTARLAELLSPLAAAVLDSGIPPMPNPVGLTAPGG